MKPANRLRLWRTEHGLSLEDVAGLTGLDRSMVSRIERGERDVAPMQRVRLARCLGAKVRDLFDAAVTLPGPKRAPRMARPSGAIRAHA